MMVVSAEKCKSIGGFMCFDALSRGTSRLLVCFAGIRPEGVSRHGFAWRLMKERKELATNSWVRESVYYFARAVPSEIYTKSLKDKVNTLWCG